MNRYDTIVNELKYKFPPIMLDVWDIESVARFIENNCFCENCEHNAPNPPWDKE